MNLEEYLRNSHQYFFTYRNGLTADVLRRGGAPYKTIFGLQLPQLAPLAAQLRELPDDFRMELAEKLRNEDTRESRLLAYWIMVPERVGMDMALRYSAEVRCREEADMIAFRLLRHLGYSSELLAELRRSELTACQDTARALARFEE